MYKVLIVSIVLLASFSNVCIAANSPGGGDIIKKQVDNIKTDIMSDIKMSMHDTYKQFKDAMKSVLTFLLELVTILAVGWAFSFLVDKRTANMIKVIVLLCGFTALLKTIGEFFGILGGV